jgi:hypothetical protein
MEEPPSLRQHTKFECLYPIGRWSLSDGDCFLALASGHGFDSLGASALRGAAGQGLKQSLVGRFSAMNRHAPLLKLANPDLVIAFPGGRGTANMVSLAKTAGIAVFEIEGLAK